MKGFLWNILLALAWVAATAEFSFRNLATGFVLGFIILYLTRRVIGFPNYFVKIPQVISLLLYFLKELLTSNLRVAFDVLTPGYHMRPGIIAIPLDAKTDVEITLLANMITFTPGSVSLDVSNDRKVLYVYVMYIDDVEEARRRIKEGLERRILAVLR
ncbi:MAG: Na+/H+ antiporter subunit E [Chloroflexi bacterium]|mgnify:CR=1 FL=1|jgi:multicomponent Na+:H+ antiporter subunit E|nr:Na+/H+ antiporter subunit E [Chloroflexota bacterium]